MDTAELEYDTISQNRRLTRKEKRDLHQHRKSQQQQRNLNKEKLNFTLKDIHPLTHNQELTFEAYSQGKHLMLHGVAGTGKSFLALYLALNQIFNETSLYKKIIIIRSTVPTRDQGFQPGDAAAKEKVYEAPYIAICTELFGRGDAYQYLKNKNLIEFRSTAFIRGITLNDSIVIADEIANYTGHELDTIITRIGKNCKLLFSGDFRQSDFIHQNDKKGLHDFMEIIKKIKNFEFIDFKKEDIVRSGLVKQYIIEKDRQNIVF